ncbi:MAG: hypothetical protein MI743_09420, partial [Sneathiellales bacterium]|nr:hypothetical protein [Sneathiellales bacterium]
FRAAFIVLCGMLAMAGTGAAEERPVGLTPHLYNPPPTLSGARLQGARSYETRLKGEIQRLERRQDTRDLRRLNRTRQEAARLRQSLRSASRPSFSRRPVVGVVRTRR